MHFLTLEIGPLADRWPVVHDHFKMSLVTLLVFSLACFVWFTLRYLSTPCGLSLVQFPAAKRCGHSTVLLLDRGHFSDHQRLLHGYCVAM